MANLWLLVHALGPMCLKQNLLREYLKVSETFDFMRTIIWKEVVLTKKHRIAGIMDDLGLTEFANKKISELSGGQKRRVSLVSSF